MSTSYKQYTQQLRDSTMFHMSLGSKELFHSNFLHWISKVNWDAFLNILHNLTGITKFWWEDQFCPKNQKIEVRREFHHFDLSIYILDSEKTVKDTRLDYCIADQGTEEYRFSEKGRTVQKWIPVLILENKMKSLPYREQLVEYTNKAFNEWRSGSLIKEAIKDLKNKPESYSDWSTQHGITFILLSLMGTRIGKGTPKDYTISQKLEYKRKSNKESLDFSFNWKHVTYHNLLASLPKPEDITFSNDKLDNLVIQDYSRFLTGMCNLADSCWKINPKASFRLQISPWEKKSDKGNLRTNEFQEKIDELKEYKSLRIHDIHEKIQYDQLLVLLESELLKRRCNYARFDSRTNKKWLEDGVRVFTKSDYAHGVGIFEAQFWLFENTKLTEDYLKLIIQVQGERYCHMVICDNVAKGAKQVNDDMKQQLGSRIVWDDNLLLNKNGTISKFISINSSKPTFPSNITTYNWGKYGNNNLYQYIDIPHDKTIEDVINGIADDINRIFTWYKPNAVPTSGSQSFPGSM